MEIDPKLHYRLHYIAKYEGRSANGQILHLICRCIRDFERERGESICQPLQDAREDEG